MTDRIGLRGIRVMARHGVLDEEHVEPQPFLVDVTVFVDTTTAATSDDLEDTVDYGRLARETHDLVAGESHMLIETVAERIAALALTFDRVQRVQVTVHKPEAPIPFEFEDVSVTIERRR